MMYRVRHLVPAALIVVAGCKDKELIARADSLQTTVIEQQTLATKLEAQKDSLTRVVLDADQFIGQMDSAIKTVRGLPRGRKSSSDPIAAQLQSRKDVQARVRALVSRAKETATQLSALEQKYTDVQGENAQFRNKVAEDARMIVDLGATIERQNTRIASLEARLDTLGKEMVALNARHYRAYYVIGTEKELLAKGIVVKEGGANLLVARAGRTLVPARLLSADAFTPVDQRELKMIQVPDSTKRYRLISRQSLDAAEVEGRKGTSFVGNLKITKPEEFWAGSRYLILVRS